MILTATPAGKAHGDDGRELGYRKELHHLGGRGERGMPPCNLADALVRVQRMGAEHLFECVCDFGYTAVTSVAPQDCTPCASGKCLQYLPCAQDLVTLRGVPDLADCARRRSMCRVPVLGVVEWCRVA